DDRWRREPRRRYAADAGLWNVHAGRPRPEPDNGHELGRRRRETRRRSAGRRRAEGRARSARAKDRQDRDRGVVGGASLRASQDGEPALGADDPPHRRRARARRAELRLADSRHAAGDARAARGTAADVPVARRDRVRNVRGGRHARRRRVRREVRERRAALEHRRQRGRQDGGRADPSARAASGSRSGERSSALSVPQENPYKPPVATVRDLPRPPRSPTFAVIVGIGIYYGGTIVSNVVVAMLYTSMRVAQGGSVEEFDPRVPWFGIAGFITGGACSFLAGYVCARLVRRK